MPEVARRLSIIEQFTQASGGPGAECEDVSTASDAFVAVFDGETNKASGSRSQPSPGHRAAETLTATISKRFSPTIGAQEAVELLTEVVAEIDQIGAGQHPAAVGAILSLRARQVWRVGDVWVGVDGHFSRREKRLDVIASQSRAAYLQCLLIRGANVDHLRLADPGRRLVLSLLREANAFRNYPGHEFSYGSFDGRPIPSDLVDVINLPSAACEVVLATDGYIDPAATLAESEARLATVIAADPLRIGHPPGLKAVLPGAASFDDRAYVRVLVPRS